MGSWSQGIVVVKQRDHGVMESWSYGIMGSWSYEAMEPLKLEKASGSPSPTFRNPGIKELWDHGVMDYWDNGIMGTWDHQVGKDLQDHRARTLGIVDQGIMEP